MDISVIIPALNEAGAIAGAVRSASGATEVLVVDGGSADRTRAVAIEAGARVLKFNGPGRGRGAQMDYGAQTAKSSVLLFLHADSRLPSNWREAVMKAVSGEGFSVGCFRLRIDSPKKRYRLAEQVINIRAGIAGVVYGDQAVFTKKEFFVKSGGFRKLSLMEDIDCVKRLRGLGRMALLEEEVAASARRWEERGFVKTTVLNWGILLLYLAGVPPDTLYRLYYGRRP